MKVELHLHTSRYSGCAVNSPSEMMRRLIEAGYEAVCITEHDAVWGDDELDDLRALFPEIMIFGGLELSLSMQHLLIIDTTDPSFLSMTNEAEVLTMAAAAGKLTILAHPFRWEGGADMLRRGRLPDAIETFTNNQKGGAAEYATEAARKLAIAAVNAGDVHSLSMIDKFWIETAGPVERASDIRDAISQGAYRNCSRQE